MQLNRRGLLRSCSLNFFHFASDYPEQTNPTNPTHTWPPKSTKEFHVYNHASSILEVDQKWTQTPTEKLPRLNSGLLSAWNLEGCPCSDTIVRWFQLRICIHTFNQLSRFLGFAIRCAWIDWHPLIEAEVEDIWLLCLKDENFGGKAK